MSLMVRDYQRTKVWRAQWEWSAALRPSYLSPQQIGELIERILRENNIDMYVRVDAAKGGKAAYCWIEGKAAMFRFPFKHRQMWVVCREVAHVLAGEKSMHDWYYCKRYLRLVREHIGPHEAASLLAAFQKHGVKLTEHRKEKWKKPFRFSDPHNRIR